jgi:hypothetical protein
MTLELSDWLNSINQKKNNLLEENSDNIKRYNPFVINRLMSAHLDTILYANEMNRYYLLDKDMQYQFYLHSIKTKRRYSDWARKKELQDLDNVKTFYGYNTDKARDVLKILTREQLSYIETRLNVGGHK